MGDVYALETPESIAVDLPIAGVGTRFLAMLIDTALSTFLAGLIVIVAALALPQGTIVGNIIGGIAVFVLVTVLIGYHLFFELLWHGQTPGKRSLHIRVIGSNGYPATPIALVIRNLMRLIDSQPGASAIGLYAIGLVSMIVDRRARRLGDLVAGTMVVKEGREGSLDTLPIASGFTIPGRAAVSAAPLGSGVPWSGGYASGPAPTPDPGAGAGPRLLPGDEALLRDFMSRRSSLDSPRRAALAAQIASMVHGRLGDPPVTMAEPERYLDAVLQAGHVLPFAPVLAPGPAPMGDALEVRDLSGDDAALVRDFLGRRWALDREARKRLASQIADIVRLHRGDQPPLAPESYLEQIAAELDRRR